MLKYILKRILMVIPVLLGVTVIIFMITRVLASDPAPVVLGEHATPEAMEAWRADNGLDDPLWLQYVNFIAGAVQGDLGTSYYTHQPVTQEIAARPSSPSAPSSWRRFWAWPSACWPPCAETSSPTT